MSANEEKPADQGKPKIQGEGDYESTRRFDEDAKRFLKTANVSDLAHKAAPKSKEEAEELRKAEEIGRSHRADKR